MFAHDLEKRVALTETLTTAFKEIDKERNRTIHQTLLLLCCSVIGSAAACPFDVRPCDSVDISCTDRREKEVGKRERKKEITT
jgi:hypothetical protein